MIRITITFHEAFNVNRQRFQDDVAFAIDLPGGIDIPNGFILKIKLKIINLYFLIIIKLIQLHFRWIAG